MSSMRIPQATDSVTTSSRNPAGQGQASKPEEEPSGNNPGRSEVPNYFAQAHTFLQENKNAINTGANLTAALANLFVFLNGNFKFLDIDDEFQEKLGNFFAKIGTATRGITGAVDCYAKKNLIPLIGSVLEVPTAMFTNGYNLWLARGIAQGTRQFQAIIKRRGMEVSDSDGKKFKLSQEDGDNFAKYGLGFWNGFTNSAKEIGKMFVEVVKNPFDQEQKFSRSILFCSMFQIIGPVVAFLGLDKLGAFLRDTGGAAVDVGYMLDKREPGKPSYFPAGLLWIGSAVCDFAKRFEGIEGSINNLTQLSLFFDPAAAIYESRANFGADNVVVPASLERQPSPTDHELQTTLQPV